ncbi:DUF6221 family protein [Streptomyces sp. NBC_01754]|uniref:DUF6221 family protein n=1 Tax=Streptomyces sp. NBC_01754 TaxID=2975930 RepID=UPI002DDC7E02|nr:DUF6221 family protein [Streptomyces sp. NBC_01754]WSC91122.1 DUF6221 family protein [Streptomyces sp. NBC_01754]
MADNADLLAFVRARLADEERVAQEAGGGGWRCPAGVPGEVHDRTGGIAFVVRSRGYDRHIALQDPARTLQRIETNRVLLDEYEEIAALDTDRPLQDFPSGRAVGLGFVVRQMAAEHAGHPDYRVRWLPRFSHWGPSGGPEG